MLASPCSHFIGSDGRALAFTSALIYTLICPSAQAFDAGSFDPGGNVSDYYYSVQAHSHAAYQTPINGVCASACTMKLGARNVCIYPDAILMFHQADAGGRRSDVGTLVLLASYPRAIRLWVARNDALGSARVTQLSGRQAIALGIPECGRSASRRGGELRSG